MARGEPVAQLSEKNTRGNAIVPNNVFTVLNCCAAIIHNTPATQKLSIGYRETGIMMLSLLEMKKLRLKGRVIELTRLCLDCDEVESCSTGSDLASLWKRYCEEHVGIGTRCHSCPRTLKWCPLETQSDARINRQLKYCNVKRKFRLPINLIDFDELKAFDFSHQ